MARFSRGFEAPSSDDVRVVCASKLTSGLLSGGHCPPYIAKSGRTAYYKSGTHEVTELHFSDQDGLFTIRRFEKNPLSGKIACIYQEQAQDPTSFIEGDVRSCRARLSDHSAIRGVGGNPTNRGKLHDGINTVLAFIDHNLNKFFSRAANVTQSKINARNLSDDLDDQPLRVMPTRDPKRWTMLVQVEDQLPRGNHLSFIQPVISRGWDSEGALIQRGKPVASQKGQGSLDAPKVGKRDRKERLEQAARNQEDMSRIALESGDPVLAEHYKNMAAETSARAKLVAEQLEETNKKRRIALLKTRVRKYRAENAALIANRTQKVEGISPPEPTAALVRKAKQNLDKVREERAREVHRREQRKASKKETAQA